MGNPSDPYSLNGWFGTAIDKKILGVAHMYKGEGVAFDPEGLMSTITGNRTGDLWLSGWKLYSKKGKDFRNGEHSVCSRDGNAGSGILHGYGLSY